MPRTALLVMDVQNSVLARHPDPHYLPRLRTAVLAARAAGLPVVYPVVQFRPDFAEVSPANRMFGHLPGRPAAPAEVVEHAQRIADEVAPAPGDVVVPKKRVSAFVGGDLDLVLRAGGIDHVVLTGVATSGVVLSTLRQGADLDLRLTVLADGCLDPDPQVHQVLVEKVFPAQAEVATVATWVHDLPR